MGGLISSEVTLDEVNALIPQMSTATPSVEVLGGTPGGQSAKFSGESHSHPRPVSVTYATVAVGTTVNVHFSRVFVQKPGIDITEIEGDTSANAQPATFKVQSWMQDGNGNYIGCVVKVWRAQVIPQNLATLLLGAIYSIFGASVVGTQMSVIAILRTDV